MYLATLLVSIGMVISSPILNTKVDDDNDAIEINLTLNLDDLMETKDDAIDGKASGNSISGAERSLGKRSGTIPENNNDPNVSDTNYHGNIDNQVWSNIRASKDQSLGRKNDLELCKLLIKELDCKGHILRLCPHFCA